MSSAQFHFTPKFVVDSTAAALLLQETYHKYPLMDLNSNICNSSKCKNRFFFLGEGVSQGLLDACFKPSTTCINL